MDFVIRAFEGRASEDVEILGSQHGFPRWVPTCPERRRRRIRPVDKNPEGGPRPADRGRRRDGDVVRPLRFVDAAALRRVGYVNPNPPKQVLLVPRTPVHIRIVTKTTCDILLPCIRSLRTLRALSSCNEARRSPTAQATAVRKLVVDEVEELGVVAVLDDLAAPGGVAAVAVVRGRGEVGVVEAGKACCGRKVETAAIVAEPAWITSAGRSCVGAWVGKTEAVQTAVVVCATCSYEGQGCGAGDQ